MYKSPTKLLKSRSFIGIVNLTLIFTYIFLIYLLTGPKTYAEVVAFRKDTDNCRPISLAENINASIAGGTGRGCTFTVDVRAAGDWVMTGAYFDSPPYGWGGDNWFDIDERIGSGDGNSRIFPYSFTCSQPSYTIDQSWLPSFVSLTNTQNIAGSGVGVPQGKRYTFQVAANATVGSSFDIPLSFNASCNMYINKSGTIMLGEPVTMDSGNCKNQTSVNINPRTSQLDYSVTVSGTSCLASTSTPTPTRTPTPTKTPTPSPKPTAIPSPSPTPVSTPAGSCPSGTELLFTNFGPLPIGSPTALGGSVTDAVTPWAPEWDIQNQDGVPLAWNNTGMTVTFPQNVFIDSIIGYDNDPAGKGGPGWSINGVLIPWGTSNAWFPPFYLGLTSNQVVFDYGKDSPHWNLCVRSISGAPTSSPTPTPTDVPGATDTPIPTATPYHTTCSAISCVAVPGAGANACTPEGGFCKQTVSGGTTSGACPSACGTTTTNQTCTCSGPCCPGTCKNGLTCGQTKPVTCCTSTQPQAPTGLIATQPDGGTTIHTRFVKLSWNFPAGAVGGCGTAWGNNCAGNSNTSFSVYIDDNDDFTSRIITVDNIPANSRSYTTTITDGVLKNNTTYYAQVCAENYLAACTEISFVKVAYPVAVINPGGGPPITVGEFDNQSTPPFSLTGTSGTSTNFTTTPSLSTVGITSSCSSSTGGAPAHTNGFSCTITLDNVNSDPIPVQPFIITASGYNPQIYTGPCVQTGPTTCNSNIQIPVDLDTNGGSTPTINQNVFFTLNPGLTFMKIKNTSIVAHGGLSSPFPVFTTLFDPADDYNNDGNFLIIGDDSGHIGGVGTGIFGAAPSWGSAFVSRKSTPPYPPGQNWTANNYFTATPFNYQRFIEYVKTRKSYQTITNLNQLSSDKINVWDGGASGPLVINNAAHFNSKNVTLIVLGTVSISTTNFTPAQPSSTAIIADQINFYDGTQMVNEAQGVFVANRIDFGTSDEPLKIVGNLASTSNPVNITRVRVDNRKPSLFITFDVDQYINLLPYISTATYDWKQLQ